MTAVGRPRRGYKIGGAGWLGRGLLWVLTCTAPALAEPEPTPAALCVKQAERAQEFYHSGDLAQARAEVALCAQTHCPAVVRNDCESWLHEWDEPVASEKDPGVTRPEREPSPLGPPASGKQLPARPAKAVAPTAAPSPAVWPWIAAAVGVAGGAGFAYFGLNGRREAETLEDTCGRNTSCTRAQVDPVREKLIIADVSLGVGVIACGVAIWGFVAGNGTSAAPSETNARTKPRDHRVGPTVELHGSSLSARFAF